MSETTASLKHLPSPFQTNTPPPKTVTEEAWADFLTWAAAFYGERRPQLFKCIGQSRSLNINDHLTNSPTQTNHEMK